MAINLSKPDDDSAVYVYEIPVRLWHWVNALAIIVLAISGYLIGSPLSSTKRYSQIKYESCTPTIKLRLTVTSLHWVSFIVVFY